MAYGQIPLRKANENQLNSHVEVNPINADFNGYTIAASLIKNYKVLKNSVTHRRLLITNIHASVIQHRHIEAKSCKLMPTSIVV